MTYTNIPKPTSQTYTKLAKPSNGAVIARGTATGLLTPPTYSTAHTIGSMYTNIPKPSLATASLKQSAKGYTGSTPLAIAFPSAVATGNLIIVCASAGVNPDTITVSDDKSNTWHQVVSKSTSIEGGMTATIYYAVANGNNTPTVSLDGSDVGGSIYEYSGLSATNVSNSVLRDDFTINPTGQPLNTTTPSVIIAMAAQENSAGTFNPCGGGFTLRNHNDAHIDAVGDYQNAPAGTYAAIFNFSDVNRWIVLQAAFALASTGYTNINKPT